MSKLLEAFKKLEDLRVDTFHLTGDCLLVERVYEEVKAKHGLVLADSSNMQKTGIYQDLPTVCRVLMVGEGFYRTNADGTTEEVRNESKPGDFVIVGQHAIKPLSALGGVSTKTDSGELGMILESEVQMRFFGEASYHQVINILRETLHG